MKTKTFSNFVLLASLVTPMCLVNMVSACKKGTDSKASENPASDDSGEVSDGEDDAGEITTGSLALNTLATAYPEGLALSVLPTKVPSELPTSLPSTSALSISTSSLRLQEAKADESDSKPTSEKNDDVAAKLGGEGDCFSDALLQATALNAPNCYNPDRDLNFVNSTTVTPQAKVAGSDESCMAGYARAQMSSTVAKVDAATGLVVAMMCQAKKDALADKLPALDKTLDLKDSLTAATKSSNLTITTATIERLPDVDQKPVYKTDLVVAGGTGDQAFVKEVHLLHSPTAVNDNTAYSGHLLLKDADAHSDGVTYLQIDYSLSGTAAAPKVQYQLVEGLFKKTASTSDDPFATVLGSDPYSSDGLLDLNHGATFGADTHAAGYGNFAADTNADLNSTLSHQRFIAFEMNPLTNAGKLMFWENFGGNFNEASRGMVFNLEVQEDNSLRGCSISGATTGTPSAGSISIRKAMKTDLTLLTPTGYYHPEGVQDANCSSDATKAPVGLCQFAPYIYKQCFAQNKDSGVYELDGNGADGFDIVTLSAATAAVTLPTLKKPSNLSP